MNVLKIILAVIVGFVAGSLVNMGLVKLGIAVVPPPPGFDLNDIESIKANAHLLEFKNYVFPFFGHALGTLVGALVAYLIAPRGKEGVAWGVGALFLLGGIAASVMIPGSKIFILVDLIFAYLPMSSLAIRLGGKLQR
jgi:hypothetical protein